MTDMRFTRTHEWIRAEDGVATVGITQYAAGQLGDVVFVELPPVGKSFDAGSEAAVVESVKAASEVYAPAGGKVIDTNGALAGDPAKVNADPEGEGWFFKLKLAAEDEIKKLMTKDQYAEYVKGL